MAVTVDELLIKIELSNQKTAKELGNISDELTKLQKSSDKTASSVGGFTANLAKFGVAGFAAVQGVKLIVDTIRPLVGSFIEAEDAVIRLNQSLQMAGVRDVPRAVDQYKNLADSIEAMGFTSAESVLDLVNLGIASGKASNQIERMIKTAADISVLKNIPLETAFNALSKSIEGSNGMLAMIFPELKNFSDEQAKAGATMEYLNYQIGGLASKNLETYGGKLKLIGSLMGDVGEEFIRILNDVFNLEDGLKSMTNGLKGLIDGLKTYGPTISNLFKSIISTVQEAATYLVGVVGNMIGNLQKGIGILISSFGKLQKMRDDIMGMSDSLGQSMIEFGDATYESGKSLTDAWQLILKEGVKLPETINQTTKSMSSLSDKTADTRKQFDKLKASMMTPEQRQALDSLKAKVIELEKASMTAGKTGSDAAFAQAEASIRELEAIKSKISGTKDLSKENQKIYNDALKLIEAQKQAQITQINEDEVSKVIDQYKSLGDEITKQTMTQRQFIDYQLQKELDILQVKRESAAFASGEAQDLLDATEKRLKAEAAKKQGAMPSTGPMFDSFTEAGRSVANSISEVFTSGALEFVGAASSAVGLIVQAANVALDIIPNMLNSIGDLFNKITDFPNILLNAFSYVFDSIIRFVTDFIPNVMNFIPRFLQGLDEFVKGLVTAFANLFSQLPDIITNLVDQLPDLIESVVDGLMSAVPEIMLRLGEFIVTKGPQLFLKILEFTAIRIPIAIMNGIWKGVSRLAEAIKAIFSGKGIKLPKVEVNTKGIEKSIARLTGESGKLFNVSDLTEAAQKPLDQISTSLSEAGKKARDYLLEAGRWLDEKLWQPLGDIVRRAWSFVSRLWESLKDVVASAWQFVKNLWEGLKDAVAVAWQFVANLWEGLKDIVAGAWQMVSDLWENLKGAVAGAWQFVKDLWDGLSGAVSGAFQWVLDKVYTPLSELGQKIGDGFLNAIKGVGNFFSGIWEGFKNLFKFDFSGIGKAISGAFDSAMSGLRGVFAAVINPIVDVFNGLIGALNNLKIPGVSIKVPGWAGGGKWNLWDDIDLIPGNIGQLAKFAQGGLVQNGGMNLPGFGTDTVPAMLTPGEFVVSKRGVEGVGLGMLQAINQGSSPGSNNYNIEFNINIDAKTNVDEGYIRGTLIPRMQEEMKRASLDGKFVISSRGIR